MSNLNRILYLQKRVVLAIVNSDSEHTLSASLFAKLDILDIFQINSFQIAKFIFCRLSQSIITSNVPEFAVFNK